MSGQWWFGYGVGLGAAIGGQLVYTLWRIRWSRRSRACRRRIAIMEYNLGYSDKPVTDAQKHDHRMKQMASLYNYRSSWSKRA